MTTKSLSQLLESQKVVSPSPTARFYLVDGTTDQYIEGADLLSHTGDVVGAEDGVLTIPAASLANAKLANVPEYTLKGRYSSGTGQSQDFTSADLPEVASPGSGVLALVWDASGILSYVDVTNLPTGSGEITTATSVGGSAAVYKEKIGTDLKIRGLTAGTGATVSQGTNDITIGVDNVPIANIANLSGSGLIGNASGGGEPAELSASTVRTLLNVADGATANSSDATLLNRANHTGTQTLSTISDAGALAALDGVPTAAKIMAVDFEQDLSASTSDAVYAFYLPYDCDFHALPEFRVFSAPTGGAMTLDIHLAGTTIYSTKPTIDATETSSTTAATASVLSTTAGTKGQLVEIFVDAVGVTLPGTGLDVTFFMTET